MKTFISLLLLACLFTACNTITGSGNIITEKRSTGAFTGISIEGPFEAEVRIGGTNEIRIEADDNIMDDINADVSGKTLKIELEKHRNLNNVHLKVFITATSLERVKGSAAANIEIRDQLTSAKRVSVETSTAAHIRAIIDAPEVECEASSGSRIELTGKTRMVNAEASSGSTIIADNLLSETTTASASSGANIDVHASLRLKASASSGAHINYRGATSVTKDESSGGSVQVKN